MKARTLLLFFLLTSSLAAANAGDIGSFVNLGFSPDSRNFMFGVFGVSSPDSHPYAEASIIDVAHNNFLPGGQLRLAGSQSVVVGQDGSGALYNILHTVEPQIGKYKIDHLILGRLIYILFNGQEPKSVLSFQDFNNGNKYDVVLSQSSHQKDSGTKDKPQIRNEAEFSISLSITPKDGTPKTYKIGKPGFFRDAVSNYLIRQIILSPDEHNIVFVVEKQNRIANELTNSYMVETAPLY